MAPLNKQSKPFLKKKGDEKEETQESKPSEKKREEKPPLPNFPKEESQVIISSRNENMDSKMGLARSKTEPVY